MNAVPTHVAMVVAVRILSMASFVRAFLVIREPSAALVRTITITLIHMSAHEHLSCTAISTLV